MIHSGMRYNLTSNLQRVASTCDAERMFHQFRVPNDQRDFLRFLWYDEDGNVKSYRMKVHLFGAKSSPGCATYDLHALCGDPTKRHSEEPVRRFIQEDFYVDDGLTSVKTPQEAIDLVSQATDICKSGNLWLHKFASNSKELLESLPTTERCIQDIHTLDPDADANPLERTLGITWAVKPDSFMFVTKLKDNLDTRRRILSSIASIYDPLGSISPYILRGKQILQQMCRTLTGWDDPVTEDLASKRSEWKRELGDLGNVSIDRCYKPAHFGRVSKSQIHNFSDASTEGYGQVSYLRLVNTANKVHCSLLMSKSRVAPLKMVTIPRLELQAAVTSTQINTTSATAGNQGGIHLQDRFPGSSWICKKLDKEVSGVCYQPVSTNPGSQ